MKLFLSLFFIITILGTWTEKAAAIRPIVHYHDLVAGGGDDGFRDGSFDSAYFNHPQGLAINPDGTQLFVADQKNNRIRIIHLDDNNRVETLAGSDKAGLQDGPLNQALFNGPTALTYLPRGQLAVYDSGNSLLRLINLEKKEVTTLAGNKSAPHLDGLASQSSLGAVWNLLYNPADDFLYFTEPETGALRKLDLAKGILSTVLLSDPHVPHPAALCLYLKHLCVADRYARTVCQVDFSSNTTSATVTILGTTQTEHYILALASWDKNLYAIQTGTGTSWVRLLSDNSMLMSVWGTPIEKTQENNPLIFFGGDDQVGLIANPKEERKFFLASAYTHGVLSLKDYDFEYLRELHSINTNGLSDFDYPLKKPPKTFRILIAGDSLSFSTGFEAQARWKWGFNRMENMPKRLELMLNAEAAMDDVPLNYEVLDIGHGSDGFPSFLWPYYEVPELVKKFDIDLVLYVFATVPSDGYSVYFSSPLTSEGIPRWPIDTEYLLKPWEKKIPGGLAEDFYKKCLQKKWVRVASKSQLVFERLNTTLKDKAVRDDLVELMGKPMGMLSEKLKNSKTSAGNPVQTQMVLVLSRAYGPGTLELYRDFWKNIAERENWPFIDLIDDFETLFPTFSPVDEDGSWRHYTGNGTYLYSYILAHELIRHSVIPFPVQTKN